MRVALARHLAVEVAPGVCYGRLDFPLTEAAMRELPGFATALCGYAAPTIWTSPARRCVILAEAVAAGSGASLRVDPNLKEMDFGDWEGRSWSAVPRADLDRWAADPVRFAPPGGESGAEFRARVGAAWEAIRAAGQDAVVVSHGGPLRLLPALARGLEPDLLTPAPPLGSVTVVDVVA